MTSLRIAAVVAIGLLEIGSAVADKPVAVEDLLVLTDGKKHFIAINRDRKAKEHVAFYSWDGVHFYRLRQRSSSYNAGAGRRSFSFAAPQLQQRNQMPGHGHLRLAGGQWTVQCGDVTTPVFAVSEKRLGRLRSAAKFKSHYHEEVPLFLARDDRGSYYYVDGRSKAYGGGGYRLFVGKRGAMKRYPLLSVIRDEVGSVFIAKGGTLVDNRVKKAAAWVESRGKETEVFPLDLNANTFAVHVSLGIYGDRLGNPCDDL